MSTGMEGDWLAGEVLPGGVFAGISGEECACGEEAAAGCGHAWQFSLSED